MADSRETTAIDFSDLQGLLRFGHGKLKEAEFLLLTVADPAAARDWLRRAPVTTAETRQPPPVTALQVALSASGLRALGLDAALLAQFPQPFLAGMAGEDSRSRRLGDVGRNAPVNWAWGVPEPHVLLMLYAVPDGLADLKAGLLDSGFEAGFKVVRSLPSTSRGIEPFGFLDGVSEPVIDWEGRFPTALHSRLDYANLLAPGELVLGLPNEYQERTSRPLLGAGTRGSERLPPAPEAPDHRDFGLNGTFLVLRQLHQDVRTFWRFLDRAADGDPARRETLAAAMVGRHRDGRSLLPDGREIPGGSPGNSFTYDDDVDGQICPLGAHIRRANPRNGDHPPGVRGFLPWLLSTLGFRRRRDKLPGRHDLVASTRFHRLVRRGREYGPVLTPEEALQPGPDEERGILFVCLCADLVRQFEFVQNAWIASPKFDGLGEEADPLLGNRVPLPDGTPTDRFSLPRAAGSTGRLRGLPPFITVRGGAYFFMPGLRALRFIAAGGG